LLQDLDARQTVIKGGGDQRLVHRPLAADIDLRRIAQRAENVAEIDPPALIMEMGAVAAQGFEFGAVGHFHRIGPRIMQRERHPAPDQRARHGIDRHDADPARHQQPVGIMVMQLKIVAHHGDGEPVARLCLIMEKARSAAAFGLALDGDAIKGGGIVLVRARADQ
jgi:hypothetical protein